jgi:hypothetical protein
MTEHPSRRAAIYVRTNKDPRPVAEFRRLNTQIELCVTAAKTKGFPEEELSIYKDECISGVAKSAPDLTQLLHNASCYSTIVVPTVDLISRDADRCARAVQCILNAGAVLWCYQSMGPVQPSNDVNKMIMRLSEFARAIDRERRSKVEKSAYANRVQMKRSAHSTTADVNSQSTIGEEHAIQKK